jgi:hypothetical protein
MKTFVASMAQDALKGSKMTFQKDVEEEVTQEKSNEQRIRELENMVKLLMKGQMANV